MPKIPRDLSWKKVVKVFERLGWKRRAPGKHQIGLTHPDFDHPLIIPCHSKPLKVGLLHRLIKDAGLTLKSFLAEL